MDSLGAIFSHLADSAQVRSDLFSISCVLRKIGVIVRNVLADEKRRRAAQSRARSCSRVQTAPPPKL